MFLHKVKKKFFFFYSVKRRNADFFLLRGMVDTLRTCPEIDKGGWLAGKQNFRRHFLLFRFLFLLAARQWKQQQNIRMKITVIRASTETRAHIKMRTQIKSPRLVFPSKKNYRPSVDHTAPRLESPFGFSFRAPSK